MIRLSKSVLDQREAEAVTRVLTEDGYLGMGSEVAKFEHEIASYIGVEPEQVVCVNSGTAALHLAVEAIVEEGDEILVPSYTFLSSYQAISASGATPVSCEIYDDTLTIDLEDAERRITEKTKAIMSVHYASNPAYLTELYAFAERNNVRVIEDAAHAFGCRFDNQLIGSFGDIICFSFDGIKNITSGEGGAVITTDPVVLERVKDARLLSVEKDSEKRYQGKRSWDFDVRRQGYRYHMSNIFAAIGRVQLGKLDREFAPVRKLFLKKYLSGFAGNSKIQMNRYESRAEIIPHIFPIRVKEGKRDALRVHLEEQGIQTGIHYKPNHLLSFYHKPGEKLPVTETVYSEILSLPLHPEITEEQIDHIIKVVNRYLQ